MNYSCSICGSLFYAESALKEHYKIHSDYSTHLCQTCGMVFSEKANFLMHQSVHDLKKDATTKWVKIEYFCVVLVVVSYVWNCFSCTVPLIQVCLILWPFCLYFWIFIATFWNVFESGCSVIIELSGVVIVKLCLFWQCAFPCHFPMSNVGILFRQWENCIELLNDVLLMK